MSSEQDYLSDDSGVEEMDYAEWKKKVEQSKDWREECFKPLTKEEKLKVVSAFKKSDTEILVSHENPSIEITGEEFQCLMPGGWLNNAVINAYFELLKAREMREPRKFLKCHFFGTFSMRYDCGMFVIKYVDFYSRDIGLCFSQVDMPYFRERTTVEILNGKADSGSVAPLQADRGPIR